MSFRRQTVSESTATRLSIYLRGLGLLETEKITRVSSQAFGRRFDLSPAQIRKDLATFGEFGVRGVGYEVSVLKKHLVSILGRQVSPSRPSSTTTRTRSERGRGQASPSMTWQGSPRWSAGTPSSSGS